MSIEASITLRIHNAPERITEIIKIFQRIGWNFHPEIEYLPLHDEDDYNWQKEKISPEELFSIIDEEQKNQEIIGLILYYLNTDIGITLLIKNHDEIIIMLNINRKTLKNSEITDISFYIEKIAVKLEESGYLITRIETDEMI